jgi:capsular polysaccharide biosynthesis protein
MLVVPLFRHRTAVLVTFFACLSAVAVLVATRPRVYEAEMKVLVNRERADSVMTPDAQSGQRLPNEVTESELYVEVELIRSREVLERVVKSIGVDTLIAPEMAQKAQRADARLAAAVAALRRDLSVDLVRKTTLIRIAYRSKDPQLAARLLSTLSTVYLEKHLAVHRPAGAYDFFSEQTRRYEQELHQAQQALSDFSSSQRVVAASTEKEIVLHNLSEFQGDFRSVARHDRRPHTTAEDIEAQLRTTPERQITQVRDSGNIELLRTLKGQILQLEGTRNEMLDEVHARSIRRSCSSKSGSRSSAPRCTTRSRRRCAMKPPIKTRPHSGSVRRSHGCAASARASRREAWRCAARSPSTPRARPVSQALGPATGPAAARRQDGGGEPVALPAQAGGGARVRRARSHAYRQRRGGRIARSFPSVLPRRGVQSI